MRFILLNHSIKTGFRKGHNDLMRYQSAFPSHLEITPNFFGHNGFPLCFF